MNEDDPSDSVHEAFTTQLFGDTPLGRPILGTVDSINAITREQIFEHYRARYTPPHLVVSAAGNLDHDTVVAAVQAAFAPRSRRLRRRRAGAAAAARRRRAVGRLRPGGRVRREADLPADRAGQPGARLRGAVPHGRPAVRARRAERGARRRHVLAALPGGAREAGPGLLGLQLRLAARRHRPVGHLRRLPAVEGRRGAVDLLRRGGEGHRVGADRRGTRPRQGPGPRRHRPRPRGPVVPDDPPRQVRARLPGPGAGRRDPRGDRRGHPRRHPRDRRRGPDQAQGPRRGRPVRGRSAFRRLS